MLVLQELLLKLKSEKGQGLVEYALIIALVSVLLVVALGLLRGGIAGVFNDIIAAFGWFIMWARKLLDVYNGKALN